MSTEAHKRKYDIINEDNNIEDNDNSSLSCKRRKLDEEKRADLDWFQTLPKEIRYNIFSYLNWNEAVWLQVVSAAWYCETLNALEVLNLNAPMLTSNKTSWLLKRCINITYFSQPASLGLLPRPMDLLKLKHFHRLKALHFSGSSSGPINTLQVTKHLTGLVELTCMDGIEDVEFLNLCKEFSQRHLTKLVVCSNVLSNSGCNHISLLTSLKDVTLWSYLIHRGIYCITTNVRRLDLTGCTRLKRVDLKKFPNLESLTFSKLQKEDVEHCSKLTQLYASYGNPTESLPIYQIRQLKDLDLKLQSYVETEDICNLTGLVNLTRLNLFIRTLVTADVVSYMAQLRQLKVLQFECQQPMCKFNLEALCTLPNLESLSLINIADHLPANISSLQHLTSLRFERALDGLQKAIQLDKLTNLEILVLKGYSFPVLSHLTRLRSLTIGKIPDYSTQATLKFIDHVACLSPPVLEEFVLSYSSEFHETLLQSSIARLRSLQTNLRTLRVNSGLFPSEKPANK